jgi:integrase
MKGFMRQRGSAWELRVYLGADPLTGRQRYATKTARVGKREAQRMLNEMVVEAERGLMTRTKATVGELLDAWLEHARGDFSPKTTREVSGYIERNLRPALGDVRLTKLTPSTIDAYYRSLLRNGGHSGQPLSPGTVRRIHGILRRALAQGVRWGWLGVNPAASATPPRVPPPEITPPQPDDLARLLQLIDSTYSELGVFVRVAAMTGARRSEVLALRWADVDLGRNVLDISRGIVMGPDGLVEKDTKTHQARRIAIEPSTSAALKRHHRAMVERAAMCGVALPGSALVFSDAADGSAPWYPDSVSRRFRGACDAAGLEGVRLHDLRHFVATRLLSAGVDVRTVAGRLGHRNAATTLNVYSHFLPESDKEAADVLGRLVQTPGAGRGRSNRRVVRLRKTPASNMRRLD